VKEKFADEKLELEIRKARADAEKAEVEADEAILRRAKSEASAENNFIYHFIGSIEKDSVHKCIHTLDNWSRLLPREEITFNIYSPGGAVIPGLALFDFLEELKGRGHKIKTIARGQAASMAAVILQAGSERIVSSSSYLLIHEISSHAIGKYSEMETDLEFSKKLQNRILKILARRSELSVAEIRERWHRTDWWLDAREARRLGFADRVV
jgi:ATP-dependent Clp endopeptidase proteolytic subunit ClpP